MTFRDCVVRATQEEIAALGDTIGPMGGQQAR